MRSSCCGRVAGPELLYQLSYQGIAVPWAGLEPATCRCVVDNRNLPARSRCVVAVVECGRVRSRTAGLTASLPVR